uniref:PLAT domain-containing protein n=1 Tax=Cyprinus carpio carpio TaxID=630221 RepID=A0A8C1A6S3_CYPCA
MYFNVFYLKYILIVLYSFFEWSSSLHRSFPGGSKGPVRCQQNDDVCYIVRGKPETLSSCNFKNTSKTFLVIHGWTVNGLFESWVEKLNYYVVAAKNTKMVGQEIGLFIDWLEESANVPLEKLHLLGYSLGAHVAGFAGSLDPAGPNFEGVHAHRRLSPDYAHFVEVLHTFTQGSLGLSIGIEQPVGHVDIYPNGGSFQPGYCSIIEIWHIFNIKKYHERSVHLFIDSLLNEGEASRAYSCGSNDMFNCGMCLQCHKNRCNTVGYDASKVRKLTIITLVSHFLISVFHYQLKINFLGKLNQLAMEPTLTVSLYGTNGEAEALKQEKITANKTYSFLVVTEKDIGDLLMLKFKLKESTSSLLSLLSSWW